MNRRTFIKKSLLGAGGVATLTGLYTWQIEPFWLEFVERNLPVANLPTELEGKTLMHISDVHIGKRFDYRYLIRSFQQAADFEPDFVAYTGDYVTLDGDRVPYDLINAVLDHAVKGKIGSVAILGNHDYGVNWSESEVADNISAQFEKRGITVLRNEKKELGGGAFLGLDDLWSANFKPELVMPSYDPQQASIALCHNPDACDLKVWNGYKGWILSGHTHGGQCKPPFLNAPILPVANGRYTAGAIDLFDGRSLYINRGVGHLFQVRFNVRPEITLFKLNKL